MVAITQTPANIAWVSGVPPQAVEAGGTFAEGKPLYQDTADQQHKLTDASALATSLLSGIALNAGVDGRKIYIAPKGARINWGATLTAGTVYCAGPTAGEIVPWADLVATDFVCVLCTGEGTAEAEVIGATGGVAHA